MKNKYIAKQIRAIEIAVESIEIVRRQKFAAGEAAYCQGIRSDKIIDDCVSGVSFDWVESDHKKYTEYTQAIRQLEDLHEILTDPGVIIEVEQRQLL